MLKRTASFEAIDYFLAKPKKSIDLKATVRNAKAWGLGSVGRASPLHGEGQRFDSASLQSQEE
jgi:hypothetical protein